MSVSTATTGPPIHDAAAEPDQGHPIPLSAVAMAERLVALAEQAKPPQYTLLRTIAEIAALADAFIRTVDAGTGADTVIGTHAVVERLEGLLGGARRATAWLRGRGPGARPDGTAHTTTGPDPVTALLLRHECGVRVMFGAARGLGRPLSGPPWADCRARIRIVPAEPVDQVHAYDLIVADRAPAMVLRTGGDLRPEAAVLSLPAVAEVSRALLDTLWAGATPLHQAIRIDEIMRDHVKLAILGQLETGAKDEVIARALGLSLRTCRRHIAEILTALGAVSRFQAGARLGHARWPVV